MKLKIKEFEKLAKKRGYRGGKAQNCNKSVPRTYRNKECTAGEFKKVLERF